KRREIGKISFFQILVEPRTARLTSVDRIHRLAETKSDVVTSSAVGYLRRFFDHQLHQIQGELIGGTVEASETLAARPRLVGVVVVVHVHQATQGCWAQQAGERLRCWRGGSR